MDLQDRPQNRDILVESAGVQVVVDQSALYVTGSELDYLDALQGGDSGEEPERPRVVPVARLQCVTTASSSWVNRRFPGWMGTVSRSGSCNGRQVPSGSPS
jgi:hypothetical protein